MARPRNFDEEQVLDKATEVFWQRGYEGASMSELTERMGLSATSIYAAFDSKRGLFNAVLDRYDMRRERFFAWINAGATAREVAERALFGIVDAMTSGDHPRGCLLLQGGVSCGPASGDIPRELAQRRKNVEISLTARLERAKAEGDLGPDADVRGLAQFLSLIWDGIGVQAAGGVPREVLRETAEKALGAWPASSHGF